VSEPIVVSWSGGKDSALTLATLRADPRVEVVALMTGVTRGYDRVSIHGVRRALLEAQADATRLPLVEIGLDPESSNAAYEAAFHDGLRRIRQSHPDVRRIAFGDLFLADVRAYRERLLQGTDFEPRFPLWGRDTAALAVDFVARGFEAHLVCVDTVELSADFAGRAFDAQLLASLPTAVDPCGERGEFHTFVSGGPVFDQRIPVRVGEVVMRGERFAYCDLLPGDVSVQEQ